MTPRLTVLLLVVVGANAFQASPLLTSSRPPTFLTAKDKDKEASAPPPQQQAIPVGTFVEFEEKKRVHIGTIEEKEHKTLSETNLGGMHLTVLKLWTSNTEV